MDATKRITIAARNVLRLFLHSKLLTPILLIPSPLPRIVSFISEQKLYKGLIGA